MLNILKYVYLFGSNFKLEIRPVLFFILWSTSSFAQQNLVYNGSFEEYSECPQGNELNNGQFERAIGWWRPTLSTPDYYNRCNNGIVGVPNNFWGHQEPFHGDGYVGFGAFSLVSNAENTENEYFRTKLTYPLKPCFKYQFSMYVSLSEISTHGIGELGAWFSETDQYTPTSNSLTQIPQIVYKNDPIIDTINWTKVEGTFVAKGFEQYLTIGYFKNNIYLDTTFIQDFGFGKEALYYVDSISLYEIGEVSSELCNYQIDFPNVFTPNDDGNNDILDVSKYLEFAEEIQILNRWGGIVINLNKTNPIWTGEKCTDGVYYYTIKFKNYNKKQTGFIHLVR